MRCAMIKILAKIASWMISAGFIYWGWTVAAKHIEIPMLTYWDVFAIRMAFATVMMCFWQRNVKE